MSRPAARARFMIAFTAGWLAAIGALSWWSPPWFDWESLGPFLVGSFIVLVFLTALAVLFNPRPPGHRDGE
jgi:hypothetical protein